MDLKLPDVPVRNEIYKFVSKFNKPELVKVLQPLLKIMLAHDVKYRDGSSKTVTRLFDKIRKPSDLNLFKKEELTQMCASFKSYFSNYIAVIEAEPKLKELCQKLIEKDAINGEELKKILNRAPVVVSTYDWYSQIMLELDLGWCSLEIPYSSFFSSVHLKDYEFYLEADRLKMMITALMPPGYLNPRLMDTLPDDPKLNVTDLENQIPENFVYLTGLASSGKLFTASGSITRSRIEMILKKMRNGMYYTAKETGEMTPGQAIVFSFAKFAQYCENGSTTKNQVEMTAGNYLRFIADKLADTIEGTDFGIFFPEYTGFTKSWASDSRAGSIVRSVNKLLKDADGKWMSMENFILRYSCDPVNSMNYERHCLLFSSEDRRRNQLKHESDKSYYARKLSVDWWFDITLPFVMRWIKLLCDTGLVEIAYETKSAIYDKCEWIRYVRLTEAGRYAFGLTKEYDVEIRNISDKAFDFDDDNSIITLLDPDSPLQEYLATIGEKIGSTRFRVTPRSFVTGSGSAEGVKKNIIYFKNVICSEPKGVWEKLIDEAIERSDVTVDIHEEFILRQLDTTVPGLIEFVASNQEIAKNCYKCEDAHLLIKEDFFQRFLKIMLNEGYILE